MNLNPSPESGPSNSLSLVVQLGFAGSRHLFDADAHPNIDPNQFHATVERHLTQCLRTLPAELNLSSGHFLCGVSQIAIGADTMFLRACRELKILNRLLLPQPLDEYLTAKDFKGEPDFTEEQRQATRVLIANGQVIHEQVASNAPDRQTRFEEVNIEMVRVSDVLVCLRRSDASRKRGGTSDMFELAARRNRPVLDIQVSVENGEPRFETCWHRKDRFNPPAGPNCSPHKEFQSTGQSRASCQTWKTIVTCFVQPPAASRDKHGNFSSVRHC